MASAELSGLTTQEQSLDIWLGTFTSKKDFETYFSEFDEYDEAEPISQFAKEQGFLFYDHDFFVAKYFPKTHNLEKILSEILVYDERVKEIVTRYQESGIGKVNFIAMQLEELSAFGNQKSVVEENYTVYYLGRFSYSGLI
jgi:hypothetical protein